MRISPISPVHIALAEGALSRRFWESGDAVLPTAGRFQILDRADGLAKDDSVGMLIWRYCGARASANPGQAREG